MKYIIPKNEATLINENMPRGWNFVGNDNIFDDKTISFFDFDYDKIFVDLFEKRLTVYLQEKTKTEVPFLIYKYMDSQHENPSICPKDQTYSILWLNKKKLFVNWELVQVDYMGKDENGDYTVLVVREMNTYEREESYITKRIKKITWYREDGTEGDMKVTEKDYNLLEAAAAWKKKRENVIWELKPMLISFMQLESWVWSVTSQNRAFELLQKYKDDIFKYIEGMRLPLIDWIKNDTELFWLDKEPETWKTTRDFILEKINYD